MTTTLISALLHIDDPRPRLADKHTHHYKRWVKNVLSLGSPLVFHSDDHYFPFINENYMKGISLLWLTHLSQLSAHKDFCIPLQQLLSSEAFRSKSYDHEGLQWGAIPYLEVIYNKLYWLVETAEQNPFNTDWFCWIDAGGIRHPIEPGLQWPSTDKLDPDKVNLFTVAPPRIIPEENWERHCLSHAAMIQGACIIGKKEPLKVFLEVFKAMVNECLGKGFIGSEQKMYDFCYSRHPELFKLHSMVDFPEGQKNVWFKFFDYLMP